MKVNLTILCSGLLILGLLVGSYMFLKGFTLRMDQLTNGADQWEEDVRAPRLEMILRFWRKNVPLLSAFCNNGDVRELEALLEGLPSADPQELPRLLEQFRQGVEDLFENERLTAENIF